MNPDVSFDNSPCPTIYFDGQNFDAKAFDAFYDAEYERELELELEQEDKELQHAIDTEFNEYDGSSVSDSSSYISSDDDDDTANISGHDSRNSHQPNGITPAQAGSQQHPPVALFQTQSSLLSNTRGESQSIPTGLNQTLAQLNPAEGHQTSGGSVLRSGSQFDPEILKTIAAQLRLFGVTPLNPDSNLANQNFDYSSNNGISNTQTHVDENSDGYNYVTACAEKHSVATGPGVADKQYGGNDEWMMQSQSPATVVPQHLDGYQCLQQQQQIPDTYYSIPTQNHRQAAEGNQKQDVTSTHFAPLKNKMNAHVQQQYVSVSSAPSPPPLPPLTSSLASGNIHLEDTQGTFMDQPQEKAPVLRDDQYEQYKVLYHKPDTKLREEEFWIQNEDVEIFRNDGSEDQRTQGQLEILYRARGREIEEITTKLEKVEEAKEKEMRILKHKLAMANGEVEGTSDSLRHCQSLLQQAKLDIADSSGKVQALNVEVASLKICKEELLKRVQMAESTIENLTHHIEELQNSESLSRARLEHDSMMSSLMQRHEKELLALKEKLDVTKASLENREEELIYVKKQLTDTSHELEQVQISRGDTINRLAKSLEGSQKQCQALLEQSSSYEISSLRVQLQHSLASKKISEDLCKTFQNETKELKEQLNMFESASSLGAFSLTVPVHHAASHNDSMVDLGIRKTLNFDTPESLARNVSTQPSDELITSLRTELEKCLLSNKQKRSKIAEKMEEVKNLREEMEESRHRFTELERTCSDQKKRLEELDSLMTSSCDGIGIIEARLRKDIDTLKRERTVLLEDIVDYKKRLEEIGSSEAKLTEINAELSHQISQMVNDFDVDKHTALERCQRTMEEVNRMTIENLRQEMEAHYKSEKSMILEENEKVVLSLKQQLDSAQSEVDSVKSLYIKKCEESVAQEADLNGRFKMQLKEECDKMKENVEKEKKEWESYLKDSIKKEQSGHNELEKRQLESQLRAQFEKNIELKVAQAHLECLEEQRATRQALIDEAVDSAKKQWEVSQERVMPSLAEDKEKLETALSCKDEELMKLKQKLEGVYVETERQLHAHTQELEKLELAWKTKMDAMEKSHFEQLNALDGEKKEAEALLKEICQKFRSNCIKDTSHEQENGMTLSHSDSGVEDRNRGMDLVKNLNIMERYILEKEKQIQEFECLLKEYHKEMADAKGKVEMRLTGEDSGIEKLIQDTRENGTSYMDSRLLQETEVRNYQQRIQELEEKLCRLQIEASVESNGRSNSDEGTACMGGEFQSIEGEVSLDKMKEHIITLESMLRGVKIQYERDLENLKQQHKKEFEKAARSREEKFQSELRYFLKEREDKNKEKLEKAVKNCKAEAKEELERVLKENAEDHRLELERTKLEWEEKSRTQAIMDVEKEKRDDKSQCNESQTDVDKSGCVVTSIKNEAVEKLKEELEMAKAKFENERAQMESQVKQLRDEIDHLGKKEKFERDNQAFQKTISWMEEEKDQEILAMSLRHEREEQKLRESLEAKMESLKSDHHKCLAQLQKELEAEKKCNGSDARNVLNSSLDQERIEEVMAKQSFTEEEVKKRLEKMRMKWLRDANEYMSREVKQGVEDRLKEEVEKMKEELERSRKELEKEKEREVREEEGKLQKEWELGREKLEREKAEEVMVEISKLKEKYIRELETQVKMEKCRLGQEVMTWKEELQKKVDEDRKLMVKTLERRLAEEREKMETELREVKEEEMREMQEEMEKSLRSRLQRARIEWEEETGGGGQSSDAVEWQERLQSEVQARTKACSDRDKAVEYIKAREVAHVEEKQRLKAVLKKCQEDLEGMKKDHLLYDEKFTEIDRQYKAYMKEAKEKRVQEQAQLKIKMETEKEKLVVASEEQVRALEDKHADEIARLKEERDKEKESLLMDVRRQAEQLLLAMPLPLPDSDGSTILELQQLDSVTKIIADVMNHVQEVNVQAANSMKKKIRKQRIKIIDIFKIQCKANIRGVLTGQVLVPCITALEQSIDALSDQLISTYSLTCNTPSSDIISHGNKLRNGCQRLITSQDNVHQGGDRIFEKARENRSGSPSIQDKYGKYSGRSDKIESPRNNVPRKTPAPLDVDLIDTEDKKKAENEGLRSDTNSPDLGHLELPHCHFTKLLQPHPQLEKVDLFDSDTFHLTPASSSNSSPASQGRTKSGLIPSASCAMSPQITKTVSSIPSKFNSKSGVSKSTSDPLREDMKRIEARVRLANWACSGEAPWKSSDEKEETHPTAIPFSNTQELNKQGNTFNNRPREGTPVKRGNGDTYGEATPQKKNLDADGFLKPDLQAEQWVSSQREKSVFSHHNECYYYKENLEDFSDESSTTTSSNVSFVTLEPDVIESKGTKLFSPHVVSGLTKSAPIKFDSKAEQAPTKEHKDVFGLRDDYKVLQTITVRNHDGNDRHIDYGFSGDVAASNRDEAKFPGNRRFGSAESLSCTDYDGFLQHKNVRAYAKGGSAMPTSTPLSKVSNELRSQSEVTYKKNSDEWKKIGGTTFFEGKGYLYEQTNMENGAERNSKGMKPGGNPQKSNSLPHQASQLRSVEKDGRSLVLKSADFHFPSDLSQITYGSNTDQQSLWKYKSLEDLIPRHKQNGDIDDMRDVRMRNDRKKEQNKKELSREEERLPRSEKDTDKRRIHFASEWRRMPPPVQAMTSEFWQEQSEEDEHHREWAEEQTYKKKYTGGRQGRVSPARGITQKDFDKMASPGNRHKSAERLQEKSQHRKDVRHSRSPGKPSHKLLGKDRLYRGDHASVHTAEEKYFSCAVPGRRMYGASNLKRSVEEMKPSTFTHLPPSQRTFGHSKMTRSLSEQSLNKVSLDSGQGQGCDIDPIASAYTPYSKFNLQPFSTEEHF